MLEAVTQRSDVLSREDVGKVSYHDLMQEMLTREGHMGDTYSRFAYHSLQNRVLLVMQGVTEPYGTVKQWNSLNRRIIKGSRAKAIVRPLFRVEVDDGGEEKQRLTGFKLVNCMFTVSETEGDDVPPPEPRTWDKAKALKELGITEVPFDSIDGNTAGFSRGRDMAISPVAKYPLKTRYHEMAHIVIGHTTPDGMEEYRQHRGLKEFQAEGTAYLVMHDLDLTEHFDAAESRAYVQNWLGDHKPDEDSIKQVFTAADRIIRAGLVEATIEGAL